MMLFLFWGCSHSPNKRQLEKSLENVGCYAALIDQLKNDEVRLEAMFKIRGTKKKGPSDPVWVDQKYRLIEMQEMISQLDATWILNCKDQVEKEDDFRGIRIIDQDLIIVEIDQFDRYTLAEKFQKERTTEFHRLIFGKEKPERTKFYFGTESLIFRDTLQENLIYEVTQLKQLY